MNKILKDISLKEAISKINTDFKSICPIEIGLNNYPNILNNGCYKCWEKAIKEYYR